MVVGFATMDPGMALRHVGPKTNELCDIPRARKAIEDFVLLMAVLERDWHLKEARRSRVCRTCKVGAPEPNRKWYRTRY